MDYGAFPPEFNSARMYAGPGPESMLAAAAAWGGLAAELRFVASSYGSVISALVTEWLGPSATAMETAAAPYVAWLSKTAEQAELTAAQAQAAAGAYQAAFAMTVSPPVIAANRAQLMTLVATNLLGQNTPAIAAAEAQYGEMWAQDATAMYGYAANSAAITGKVTPTTAAPQTTNLAGLAAQGAAAVQSGMSAAGGVQSTLSQLVNTVSGTLESLASPGSSTSGLSGILNGLLGASSAGASTTGFLGSSTAGDMVSSLEQSYLQMPGWLGMFMGQTALGALVNTPMSNALSATPAAAAADVADAAEGAADAAAGAADAAAGAAADGALAGGFDGLADSGLAGLGQAAAVGGLSVPANWGWAATAPAGLLGSAPMLAPAVGSLATGTDLGAGFGFPFMFPGMPGVAAASGAGSTRAVAKYGVPLAAVMTRPPAAGYGPESASKPPPAAYPVPAGFPANGHAPPGYQPAIIYLPANGHAKTDV